MSFQLTGDEVPGDDAPCLAIDADDVQHFMTGKHLHIAKRNLPFQSLVGSDQQLLAGLTCRIEGTLYLRSAKRAVAQQTTVFTGKRDTLCHTLVDDAGADLGQAVNVGFPGTVISTLDSIVKQTE